MDETCKLSDGVLKPCKPFGEVLEMGGQGTRFQGAKLLTMVDTTTLKFSRNLAILKSGEHARKGLVMNFCPFCGEEIVESAREMMSDFLLEQE